MECETLELGEAGVVWAGVAVVLGGVFCALYEVPLGDIHSEEDLLALAARGELSDESLTALLRLWHEGVFPDTASRAELLELPGLKQSEVEALLAHREKHGRLGGVDEWLLWGLVSEEQAQQLRPFVRQTHKLGGHIQLKTAGALGDERPPPALLKLRMDSSMGFRAAATFNATRLYAKHLKADAQTLQLSAAPEGFLLRLPSAFAQAEWRNFQVTLGNFRLGFGERLTLCNSFKQRPQGIDVGERSWMQRENKRKCPSKLGSGCKQNEQIYVTPDFEASEGFRGLAVSSTWPLSKTWELEGAVFGSWQSRDLYQYAFFNPDACTKPQSACSAPPIFVDGKKPLRHSYASLVNVFDERLLGMAAHALSPHFSFGTTAYVADNRFHLLPMQPRFQPWASQLNGRFGAVGINAKAHWKAWLFAAEWSRSFDQERGGGFAAVVRVENETLPGHSGLELRWLSPTFKNPMAKPRSAPDEYWGTRAINELGLFAHTQWKFSRLLLYASANLWQTPQGYNPTPEGDFLTPSGTFHLESRARLEWQALDALKPFALFSSSKRNLFSKNQALCEALVDSSSGSLCDTLRASLGLKALPHKNLHLLLRAGGFRKRFVANPKLWRTGMESEAELNFKAWRWFSPGLWLLWRQEDVGETQRFGHLLWLRFALHSSLAKNFDAHFFWAFGRAFEKRTNERNDGHMNLELNYRF